MVFIGNFLFLTIIIINITKVLGHGMVMDPVGRGSAWRKGFKTPKNYDDNGNFCGGFYTQHISNHGRCGMCGDNYSIKPPRPHENGGFYGNGIIVKKYEAGSIIDVTVKLTASHLGYFEFTVCPLKHNQDIETEECFEQYPLSLAAGGTKFPVTKFGDTEYHVNLVLPSNLTCQHCSFRWHYKAGNNWGRCPNGTERLGCGNQETFRTCSDIAIV